MHEAVGFVTYPRLSKKLVIPCLVKALIKVYTKIAGSDSFTNIKYLPCFIGMILVPTNNMVDRT